MTDSTIANGPKRAGSPGWIIGAVLIVVMAGWSAVTFFGWYTALRQPADLDYAEGWHAYAAQQAAPGGHHVGAARAVPHNVLPYPPLGYIVIGAAGKVLGGSLEATRTAARYCSLVFTLSSTVLILLLSRLLRARWRYAAFAALVFLNLHSIQLFAISIRPDALALTLTLLAVYAALRFESAWAAGTLLTLAVFAKHSYVSAPITLFGVCCLRREWKFVYALVLSAVVTCVVAVWVSWLTMGPHWFDGPLLQGFHGAKPGQVLYLMFIACRGAALPLAAGLAAAAMPGLPRPARVLAGVTLVSLTLNVIAMVKPGASMNYLLEPTAFALVLVAYGCKRSLPTLTARARASVWLAAAVALSLLPGLESVVELRKARAETSASANRGEIAAYLKGFDGPILATDAWMYFETNHEPWVCPSDLVSVAVESKIIPDAPMLERLRMGYFRAIVLTASARAERPFPAVWMDAVTQYYTLAKHFEAADVYLPKQPNTQGAAP